MFAVVRDVFFVFMLFFCAKFGRASSFSFVLGEEGFELTEGYYTKKETGSQEKVLVFLGYFVYKYVVL